MFPLASRPVPLAARLRRPALATALLLAAACGGGGTEPRPVTITPPPTFTPLRALAAARTPRVGVGTAVGALFGSTDAGALVYTQVLAREFDVVVAENDMKFSSLQPTRGAFRWARADSIMAFAQANNMRVRGHTIAWHQQNPAWVTAGAAAWSADTARAVLGAHVAEVVGRYRGRVAAWDVVNEAYTDGAAPVLRANNPWQASIGRGYVEHAFRAARAADPAALLFYNDYNIEAPGAKTDSVYNLLAELKGRGVPVDGIGFQAHFIASAAPSQATLQAVFARFAALGLKVHVTELDVRVPTPASEASLRQQAQVYRDVFAACYATPACEMVVTWGFTDRLSWVPSTFPGQGEALLYNAAMTPKPAYVAVHDFLAGR